MTLIFREDPVLAEYMVIKVLRRLGGGIEFY